VTALGPVIEVIASLTAQIRTCERALEVLAEAYPETLLLRQVKGVGPITSLAFVLTLEDPTRFAKSRAVGPYLGLVPAQRDSGESKPQLRISKEGDAFLRRLLVGSAQYILGSFGEDCDLRRHGMKLGASGSKKDKKRAVVAVARSWPSSCTVCGRARRPTTLSTTPNELSARASLPERNKRRHRGKCSCERTVKPMRLPATRVHRPVRVTAVAALVPSGRFTHPEGTPIARLQHPNWMDPSVHRAQGGSQRVRMEAWRSDPVAVGATVDPSQQQEVSPPRWP